MTRLRCDLVAAQALDDSLTILTREGPLATSNWPAPEMSDSIWVFDRWGDGTPELIVDFHPDGQALVADLYDAQGRPEQLRYTISDGGIQFVEGQRPAVRVVARDGWWMRGSRINMNLELQVDGRIEAAPAFDTLTKIQTLATDGRTDFALEIGDADGDGRPDYDWRTVFLSPGETRAIEQGFVTRNVCDNEPALSPMLPWPYLGSVTEGFSTVSLERVNRPPIQVNWDTGTIVRVGEFVRSRGNDCQWFVSSYRPVVAGEINETDFENPFGWYDLGDDDDGIAELAIRMVYYPAWDEQMVSGTYPKPINAVRYSWDQDDDGHWDYKLGLLGNHVVTSSDSLPRFSLRMVPYAELPGWVTERNWVAATFVASEVRDTTGEGIYVWDHPAWYVNQYFTGRMDAPVAPELPTEQVDLREYGWGSIPAGFRGEWQDELGAQALIYASPIDRKLHLLNAAGGMWLVDETASVAYSNLDGDGVIDQWRFRQSVEGTEEVSRELDVSSSHMVYFGEEGFAIRVVDVRSMAFTTLPPSTHEGWRELDSRLGALGQPLGPGDFRDTMATFPGPELVIRRATGRDYRPTPSGFRFILDLPDGFRVEGDDFVGLAGRAPGSYVVAWDGAFTIEALRPPDIQTTLNVGQPAVLAQTPVVVQVANVGLTDVADGRLELWATAPDGASRVVASQAVAALVGESSDVELVWAPHVAGDWSLQTRVIAPDGEMTLGDPVAVAVPPIAAPNSDDILAITAGDGRVPMLMGVLLLISAMAALTAMTGWWRRLRQ